MNTLNKDKTVLNVITVAIFSALLSASFVLGQKAHLWSEPPFDSFRFADIVYWMLLAVALFFVVINALEFVYKRHMDFSPKELGFSFWLKAFGIIVFAWLPYLFIYYPGNLSGDSFNTVNQVLAIWTWGNHHPIMFTLFVNFFVELGLMFGDLNFGVACFSFAQILVMASVLSYCAYWFAKKGVSKSAIILTVTYFALDPVIAMYSITMWKDVMFAGWMVLLIMFLYDTFETEGKLLVRPRGLISISVYCFLVSFGRNNGIYIIVVVLLVLGLYFRRYYKRLVPLFLSIILSIVAIQGPLYSALGIRKGGFAESLGVPLQQIGYTLKYDGDLNTEQEAFLNQIMPIESIKSKYDPRTSDTIKFDDEFDSKFLEAQKGQFFKVWAQMLPENFSEYVKAYLMLTLGYWHIGTTGRTIQTEIDSGSFSSENIQIFHTYYADKIAGSGFTENLSRILTSLGALHSNALVVWILLFYCMLMLIKKKPSYIIPVVPLITLWATMMAASPIFCELRYMYSLHLSLPFLVIAMLYSGKAENMKTPS